MGIRLLLPTGSLETFLGGMEIRVRERDRGHSGHLETFLGGMEMTPFVFHEPNVPALKPSLVEWKCGMQDKTG